jgi:hypothetical protein
VPSATSQHHLDKTDVVIPSNLLAALTSGPYITDTNQFEGNDAAELPNYNVRQIAQQLQGETSRILARSASVAVAGLSREFAFGVAPEFRKTSLGLLLNGPNQSPFFWLSSISSCSSSTAILQSSSSEGWQP